MSQIAIGFLPDRAALAEAVRLRLTGDDDRAFDALDCWEFGTFDWSGYIVVALDCWLEEQGVELPRSDPPGAPGFLTAWEPVVSASGEEAAAAAAALEAMQPEADELAAYWEEFTGERAPDAGEFMAAGWVWLLRLLRAGAGSEWCVLVVS